jgi:hypothetical protein
LAIDTLVELTKDKHTDSTRYNAATAAVMLQARSASRSI